MITRLYISYLIKTGNPSLAGFLLAFHSSVLLIFILKLVLLVFFNYSLLPELGALIIVLYAAGLALFNVVMHFFYSSNTSDNNHILSDKRFRNINSKPIYLIWILTFVFLFLTWSPWLDSLGSA